MSATAPTAAASGVTPTPAEGKLFEVPKPELTLLLDTAEAHDPEGITISFGGSIPYSAYADSVVKFVNGMKPGRRRRITVDVFATKAVASVKEDKEGSVIDGALLALKVEGIDFDHDPWDASDLAELRREAGALLRHYNGLADAPAPGDVPDLESSLAKRLGIDLHEATPAPSAD